MDFTALENVSILREYNLPISPYVHLTKDMYDFWSFASKYLPDGVWLSEGYKSPNDLATIVLDSLSNPDEYFNEDKTDDSSVTLEQRTYSKYLTGQYKNTNDLYKYDYEKIKSEHSNLSDYITAISDFSSSELSMTISWISDSIKNEDVSNIISKCSAQQESLHVVFYEKSIVISKFSPDAVIPTTISYNTNINPIIKELLSSDETVKSFYQCFNKYGFKDLKDMGINTTNMSPNQKELYSRYSRSIVEGVAEILCGSNGLLSNIIGSFTEYLASYSAGLSAALNELSEINPESKKKAVEAFKAVVDRNTNKNIIRLIAKSDNNFINDNVIQGIISNDEYSENHIKQTNYNLGTST